MVTLTQHQGRKPLTSSNDGTMLSPLGNIASISSLPAKKHNLSTTQQKKQRRFRLLDAARRILRNHNMMTSTGKNVHRTRRCLTIRFDATEPIGITLNDNPEKSTAGVQNLQTCGSICSCPVCAHKKMLEKSVMIRQALEFARISGLVPIMVTLTASHHKGMKLSDFVTDFKNAWRKFSSGSVWRRFKQRYSIEHWINAREVTRDAITDNGWHYHQHILMFLDASTVAAADDIKQIDADFTEQWLICLNKNNLTGLAERACDVRAGENVGAKYLTKLGLTENAKGKLDYEMTGSENKGRNIWDILEDAAFGDIEAEYLYLEYVKTMSGENWITTSHGLTDLVKDIQLPTDEDFEPDKLYLWYWISQENWNIVTRNNAVGELLMIAAKYRCRDKVREFIRILEDDR